MIEIFVGIIAILGAAVFFLMVGLVLSVIKNRGLQYLPDVPVYAAISFMVAAFTAIGVAVLYLLGVAVGNFY